MVSSKDVFCYRCGCRIPKSPDIPEDEVIWDNSREDDEDASYVLLKDEYGNDKKFEFLDLIEFQNRSFIVLLPADDESGMVNILEVKNEGSEYETYESVEDKYLLNKIFDLFKEENKDFFKFVD